MTVREWFRTLRREDWERDKEQLVNLQRRLEAAHDIILWEHFRTGPLSGIALPVKLIEASVRRSHERETVSLKAA